MRHRTRSNELDRPDYYSVLQVACDAEGAVIRGAYLALMRRYHPDTNRSTDAAAYTGLINTAYAVLSDRRQRAEYDLHLANSPAGAAVFRRLANAPVLIVAATMGLAAILIFSVDWSARPIDGNVDRVTAHKPIRTAALNSETLLLCSSRTTYEAIKRNLFQRAAQLRGSQQVPFGSVAKYSIFRVNSASVTGQDKQPGQVSCMVSAAVDLPPGLVASGRRTITGSLTYSLGGDDGNHALTMSDDGGIVRILATVEAIRAPSKSLEAPVIEAVAQPVPRPIPVEVESVQIARPVQIARQEQKLLANLTTARARANVGTKSSVSHGSEEASCRTGDGQKQSRDCESSALAMLDRRHDLLYSQSYNFANSIHRRQLQLTAERFVVRRQGCRTDACIKDMYLARMREITDIMTTEVQLRR